jgi:hypothetical protein
MLFEQTGYPDWQTPFAGSLIVQVANDLGNLFKYSAGSSSGWIGVLFEPLFSVGTVVAMSVCVIWFTLLGVRLAFSCHSVED